MDVSTAVHTAQWVVRVGDFADWKIFFSIQIIGTSKLLNPHIPPICLANSQLFPSLLFVGGYYNGIVTTRGFTNESLRSRMKGRYLTKIESYKLNNGKPRFVKAWGKWLKLGIDYWNLLIKLAAAQYPYAVHLTPLNGKTFWRSDLWSH